MYGDGAQWPPLVSCAVPQRRPLGRRGPKNPRSCSLRFTIPIACGDTATRLSSTGFIRTDPPLALARSSVAVRIKPYSLDRQVRSAMTDQNTWWMSLDINYVRYQEVKVRKVVAQGWPQLGDLAHLVGLGANDGGRDRFEAGIRTLAGQV